MCHYIALEGIAGAGKTSCFTSLIQNSHCSYIFLSEPNPPPDGRWANLTDVEIGDQFDQLWLDRYESIKKIRNLSFVFDRSYLSNLAFWYAYDRFYGTDFYPARKVFAIQNFPKDFLTSVCIFTTDPKISIQRRESNLIPIPYPWGEASFLNDFQEFYQKELSGITSAKITFVDSTNLPLQEQIQKVRDILEIPVDQKLASQVPSQIERFSHEMRLGPPLTNAFYVLGRQTVYYRQHSVQLDGDKVVLFNTGALNDLFGHRSTL